MPTVLVTGASRGLGLEFVRQYAADGWRVLAVVRDPAAATDLAALATASGGRVTVHTADMADFASIDALAASLRGTPVDVLINNAGTMGRENFAEAGMNAQRFGHTHYDDWTEVFRVNVEAPMKMAEALIDNVLAGGQKKIVTLTSQVGSITNNRIGGLYTYRSTKAAANMVMKSMAIDLAKRGVVCAPLHPGWARTGLGGPDAPLEPTVCVTGLRRVIADLSPETTGRFLQYDGTELPW